MAEGIKRQFRGLASGIQLANYALRWRAHRAVIQRLPVFIEGVRGAEVFAQVRARDPQRQRDIAEALRQPLGGHPVAGPGARSVSTWSAASGGKGSTRIRSASGQRLRRHCAW